MENTELENQLHMTRAVIVAETLLVISSLFFPC
jgi:hypothetical protein